jgi:PAS domain S-box-containing protein
MESALRRTGINVIGDVPWGTHFCQFYEAGQDLIDILVPYFKEGLDAGEFCMWVTSEPLRVEQATAALRAAVPNLDGYMNRGQIEILDYSQWYTRSGRFSADEVLQGWVDKLTAAQERGFEGLRLTGNTFWLEKAEWDDFARYEEKVNNVIGRYPMLAICTYSLQKCNALEILDVIANHQFALIKRSGQWDLIESTHHKKVEQALRESEERYSTTLASIGDAVIAADVSGNITFINAVAEELTGWPIKEALHKPVKEVFNIVNEYTRREVKDPVAKVLEKGAVVGLANHTVLVKRDGKEVPIDDSGAPIRDRNGNIIGVVLVFRDITERKRVEDDLARFASFPRLNPNPIIEVDLEGCVFFLNPAAQKLLPGLQEKGQGHPWLADWESVAFMLCDSQTGTYSRDISIGDKWYQQTMYLVPDVQRIRIYGLDITERKRAEETLRKSENQFRVLIDNLSSGVALVDEHGKFTIYNPAFLQMFGLFEDPSNIKNVNDQNWSDWQVFGEDGTLLHVDDHPVRKAAMTGKPVSNKLVGVRLPSGGELVWMLISAEPILKPDGKVDLLICTYHNVTERKQAEEALRESEQRLRLALRNAPVSVSAQDHNLRYVWAYNQRTARPEEIIGKFDSDIFTAEEAEHLTLIKRRVLDENIELREQMWLDRPGGRMFLDVCFEPIHDRAGRVIGVGTATVDLTPMKITEEALRESQALLRAVTEGIPDPIFVKDCMSRIIMANPATLRVVGKTLEEAIGKNDCELYNDPAIGVAIMANDRRIMDTGRMEVVEEVGKTSDGYRTFLSTKMPYRNSNGEIIGILGITRDITEGKRASEALEESEAKYRNLFMNMTEEVHFWKLIRDKEGRIKTWSLVDVNPPTLKTWGKALDEIKGRTTDEIFGPGATEHYMPVVQKIMAEGTSYSFEDYFPNLDKHFRFTSVPLGEYFITTGADITGIKKVQAELLRARDELEQRVQERTAQLQDAKENLEVSNEELRIEIDEHEKTEKELLRAKDAAEEAAKAKSLFLANMSHELRTPMNAVIGFTGLLLDEPLTPEQKDYLESIRNSGQALLALISDLLDFSRMERENVVIEKQPFDLRSCIEEALDLVASEASKKNLDLAYIVDKDMPEAVTGDPARLRQVLANLLGNAVKYTDKGEAVLSVLPKGQDEILFEIRDTGIGIPEDKVNILFRPFSRVDESFSSRSEGAGLGLAISKKLVEMMGGKIWVESAPGRGSTFSFTIKAKAVPGKPKAVPIGIQPRLEGKHILIVDDNKTNRVILGKQLNSWGIIPLPKPSGQEALAMIRGGTPFDAAILDMMMPDMDGIALASEIRKYRKDLPLIMLSSAGQKAKPELFEAVLNKPIKPVQLHKVLLDTLEAQQSREEAKSPGLKANYRPMRILLAEDNVSNQRVTLEMLKKLGYRADAVANGAEAIQALERQPYDLVLMDVKMPVLGGIEATRMIRERWPDNGPKIIATTAYALHGDREKCLAAGMDDYLAKPVQKEELAEVLERYRQKDL